LREERRLRVFENRVLKRIFGSKRDEVTGEWRKLHNDQYCSHSIVRMIKWRRMRWEGHTARMERRGAYKVLVGSSEGKRLLGRPRRRWDENIKMELKETELEVMDWIDLADDRDGWQAFVNEVMNLRVT